jgi:hypothetical protein
VLPVLKITYFQMMQLLVHEKYKRFESKLFGKVLSQNLPGGTEEKYKNPMSG